MLVTVALAACGQVDVQSADASVRPSENQQQAGASCTSNAQCSGANPICDVLLTHKCQPCTLSLECLLKDATYPVCISGSCGGCSSNANCSGNTPVCDTLLHTCVAGTCPGIGADVDLLGLNLTASVGEAHTGDTRVYACINDTVAVGVTISVCQSDGTWSNPPPTCVSQDSACTSDASCASNQWCRFSGGNGSSGQCAAKVGNGGDIPIDPQHPGTTLDGTCGPGVGAAVCASGVCDSDNKCGYVNGGPGTCEASTSSDVCRSGVCGADAKCGHPNGEGTCSLLNASTVCRSGSCSTLAAVCVPTGGCGSDLDCGSVQWCNTQTFTCTSRLPNSTPIPTVSGHSPALTGTCNTSVAASVCVSATCSTTDNACGYPNGEGTCTALTAGICRSGVCDSILGKCAAAPSCTADAQCALTQYCDTDASVCVPKVPNGGDIPTVSGHTPVLDGTCTTEAALAACQSGVCGADNKCGLGSGEGVCTVLTAGIVCRSSTCSSVLGVCMPSGGCASDIECAADQYCDTSIYTCVPQKKNGEPIPPIPGHTPPIDGSCNALSADSVCSSGVCDTSDDKCGYVDGSGPCTKANGSGVCRSGYCGDDGNCMQAPTCTVDTDCDAESFCGSGVCHPKLRNGDNMPSYPNHDPELNGVCTEAAAAKVCLSGVCDTIDNKCGYHTNRGPCTATNGATVCRTGVCAPDAGICVVCVNDSQCGGSTSACDTVAHVCAQCTVRNSVACVGSTPVCDIDGTTCSPCGGDYGSRADNACGNTAAPYCFSTGAKAGQCGKCTASTDCAGHPTGDVCDTGTGACLPGCGSDADCYTGWTCSVDGACVPPEDDPSDPTDDPSDPDSNDSDGTTTDSSAQDAGLVPAGAGCSATGTDASLAALVVVVGLARIVTRKRKMS